MLSVIIPIYNEEKILGINSSMFFELSCNAELIFVDGGSVDRSIEIARQYGRVLQTEKGRAIQMNYGAKNASHDTLLFLHADNIISPETLLSIEKKVKKNGFIAGCLTQRIAKKDLIFRLIEVQGNMRARISKIFYGDQGIFLKKDIFLRIGGFPNVPILEDVLFTKRLHRYGRTTVMPDKILVSARRWEKMGVIKTTLLYSLINLLFKIGFPLKRIKNLYDDLR